MLEKLFFLGGIDEVKLWFELNWSASFASYSCLEAISYDISEIRQPQLIVPLTLLIFFLKVKIKKMILSMFETIDLH